MTINILIGVGGTGAKVVEATIHAAAAGLGPETLKVGFVDQDQSNGNVARALQLLEKVTEARELWRASGAKHRLGPESDLLRTDIAIMAPNAKVWTPNQGRAVTLKRIFGAMPEGEADAMLFDLLFAKGEAEQDMVLDEGYRGRPHIGSAAISSRVDDDDEFWRVLIQQIKQAQSGSPVRVLLAGSVFGGTGAAGFPTLARLIRNRLKKEDIQRNVHLGGVLMLPYFSFDPPPSDEGQTGNVARSEQLLMQSRGALNYYDDLFRTEAVFDELYFVGWNTPFDLGYHKPGAADQANPALPPELMAALGACRFFHPGHALSADEAGNRVLVCARERDEAVGWSDLPSPTNDAPEGVYARLGGLLRFAIAWKHWSEVLAKPRGALGGLMSYPWVKAQKVGEIDYRNEPPAREMKALGEYLDLFLIWAATNQTYTSRANTAFRLWKLDELLDGQPDFSRPQAPVRLKGALNEQDYARAFDAAVIEKPGADQPPSANELLALLNTRAMPGDHRALGRMVAALHAYSSVVDQREGAA